MDKISEIKEKLREIVAANPNLPLKGLVKKVEAEQCDVMLESGLILTNVKLKATVNESENFMIAYPKIGSQILMLSLSGQLDNMTVIKVDEVEKLSYSQNGLKVLIDSTDGKVAVKNTDVSLYECFNDLVTLLKGFKVYTPAGPSGTALPPTVLKINQFETKFKEILKSV